MGTPVLSKEQLRKSISAQKGPAKGLRNVLALPYEKFWPVIRGEDEASLEEALKKSLSVLKRVSPKIPWSELRKMSKEQRSSAKKNLSKKENVPDDNVRKSVIMGINAVTRSLEKYDANSVLVDATVDPPLLIKHIVSMSSERKLPIILVPFLKKVTLETLGYASAALAFTNEVASTITNDFHEIHKLLSNIYNNFPKPKSSTQLFETIESENEAKSMDLDSEEQQVDPKKSPLASQKPVYLYRNSIRERVFVPPTKCGSNKNENNVFSSNFISLGDCSEFDDTTMLKTKKRYIDDSVEDSYVPLKVKKFQANSNRTKATKLKKKK